jgi:predicted nucleic-acid-binding protein
MIGIDPNILVRYLTQDDSEQAKIVEKTLNKYATSSQSIFINNIVICELIWVLERGIIIKKVT